MKLRKNKRSLRQKELKIRPGTGEHDYQVKIKNAQKIFEKGNN